MIGFNVAPFTGKEFDYIREAGTAGEEKAAALLLETLSSLGSSDHLLYPCHRDGGLAP